MRTLFLLLCTFYAFGIACAEEFRGKVVVVVDGDTVMLVRGNDAPTKVRLVGIDAPEKEQTYGLASKKSLRELVLRKQVQVSSKGVDDYGRLLAEISVGGLNINHEQVRRGMAWNYSRFRANRDLADLQLEAQQARRGLWADATAIEPYRWRKQHPTAAPVTPATVKSDLPCSKQRCAEMTSCEEAKYYLAHCHTKTIDGDGDGMPCEKLCSPKQ